jgi:hypothetical protein
MKSAGMFDPVINLHFVEILVVTQRMHRGVAGLFALRRGGHHPYFTGVIVSRPAIGW